VAQWLRYCATNQKVAVSIPDGVVELFIDIKPSDRTMALGSTQPLTEMSTRRISWRKCSRCVRLTTLPLSCAVVKQSGNFNFLEPSGSSKDTQIARFFGVGVEVEVGSVWVAWRLMV
jgi:hypothetical protein